MEPGGAAAVATAKGVLDLYGATCGAAW